MKEEIIKPGIVRRIIERVENENGLVISPETTDIILTAFLDTVADILSEGDMITFTNHVVWKRLAPEEKIELQEQKNGIGNVKRRNNGRIKRKRLHRRSQKQQRQGTQRSKQNHRTIKKGT